MASVLHAQIPPSPQGDNQTKPPLPPSPSREMLTDDINQLQDLLNLLAMHISQCNTPSSPYSPNLPHTLNLNQVEQHVGYCPTASRLRPNQFTYPERELIMEEILYKFINEGKREHEEMRPSINDFPKTTIKSCLKKRQYIIELRFEVQNLLKIIESPPTSNCEIKGVTTRGGKTTTQDVQKDDTNMNGEEPHEEARDKPVESNEVVMENQPQGTNAPMISTIRLRETKRRSIPFPKRLRKENEEA
ncbi:hypothetical protein Tco_0666477 [Tanacetum coccineum]